MISVIIPLFNAENSILKALDSVRHQTYSGSFEIIVINDGSTDSSRERVEDYMQNHSEMEIILLNQPNNGVSVARNKGLQMARNEFIALLDADDVWLPQKTARQMHYFNHSQIDIDFLATARNNRKLLFPYHPIDGLAAVTFRKLLIRNEIVAPSVIFKKRVLENTGYFDESMRHAEDVDYYLRISRNNRMYILAESLVIAGGGKRSFGVSGLSADLREMAKGYQKIIEKLYKEKRIGWVQSNLYKMFYRIKYGVLKLRARYRGQK